MFHIKAHAVKSCSSWAVVKESSFHGAWFFVVSIFSLFTPGFQCKMLHVH